MRWGLEQLGELPLSTRLLREMHRRLMAGARGRERAPGELRTSQNWIGAPGSTIETAQFVPPPPGQLPNLLSHWERFAHEEAQRPLLIQNALLHSQLETIHPFLDGNGRLGRLLSSSSSSPEAASPRRCSISAPTWSATAAATTRRCRRSTRPATRSPGSSSSWRPSTTQATDAVARARGIIEVRERYRRAAAAGPRPPWGLRTPSRWSS
jgi:fido (protein-threonine AMPylation protein)